MVQNHHFRTSARRERALKTFVNALNPPTKLKGTKRTKLKGGGTQIDLSRIKLILREIKLIFVKIDLNQLKVKLILTQIKLILTQIKSKKSNLIFLKSD